MSDDEVRSRQAAPQAHRPVSTDSGTLLGSGSPAVAATEMLVNGLGMSVAGNAIFEALKTGVSKITDGPSSTPPAASPRPPLDTARSLHIETPTGAPPVLGIDERRSDDPPRS